MLTKKQACGWGNMWRKKRSTFLRFWPILIIDANTSLNYKRRSKLAYRTNRRLKFGCPKTTIFIKIVISPFFKTLERTIKTQKVPLSLPFNLLLVIFVSKHDKFSSKSSSGHVECSFDNPAENFSPRVREFFASSAKIIIKLYFFSQKIFFFPQNDPLDYMNFAVECK